MLDRPKISVVLPTHNALRWLPGAFASLGCSQELEILVVDDGSDDGSSGYLRGLAAHDRRLRPLSGAVGGSAGARNVALGAARAPLIAFLDADDRWRCGKIAAQLEMHRLFPELGFSFSDYRRFAEDGTELAAGFSRCTQFSARHAMRREGFVLGREAQAAIYAEPIVATSTVMARTDLLRAVGGFNENLSQAEDWDLWLHLAACAQVGCLPKAYTDCSIRGIDPDGPHGIVRRIERSRVANAYAKAVDLVDREALQACRTSLLAEEADEAALAGHRMQAVRLRLSAFVQQPSRKMVRAAALDLLGSRA